MRVVTILFVLGLALALAQNTSAQVFTEVGDIGSHIDDGAFVPFQPATLLAIEGEILLPEPVVGAGDADLYEFFTGIDGVVTFSTCGMTSDTELFLLDAAGALLAGNDDFCGLQSEISWPIGAGTSYWIGIGYFNTMYDAGPPPGITSTSSSTGPYTITVTFVPASADDFIETPDAGADTTTAEVLPLGSYDSITGSLFAITAPLAGGGDADLFAVYITEPDLFSATTCDVTAPVFDTQLFLLDAAGALVAFNDDDCGLRSTIPVGTLSAGDEGLYYIGVCYFFCSYTAGPPPGIVPSSGTLGGYTVGVTGGVIPVELVSFSGTANGNDVDLVWETASETNNAGFEVQMRQHGEWGVLGFVDGHGTTTEAQRYTFSAANLINGTYAFRLRQIDFDGAFEYSAEVEVTVETPGTHVLTQAYPNPFNPQAQFTLSVARDQQVDVGLYNVLGQKVATLFNGSLEANATERFTIDGADLASGLYVVRVIGEAFTESMSVTLLK